jgi:hypothetical protein
MKRVSWRVGLIVLALIGLAGLAAGFQAGPKITTLSETATLPQTPQSTP